MHKSDYESEVTVAKLIGNKKELHLARCVAFYHNNKEHIAVKRKKKYAMKKAGGKNEKI